MVGVGMRGGSVRTVRLVGLGARVSLRLRVSDPLRSLDRPDKESASIQQRAVSDEIEHALAVAVTSVGLQSHRQHIVRVCTSMHNHSKKLADPSLVLLLIFVLAVITTKTMSEKYWTGSAV